MNNKMAVNMYLSTTESKQQTKQTSRTEGILMVARWEGSVGEWEKR